MSSAHMGPTGGEDIYASPNELTVTRDGKVVGRFECERSDLWYDKYPPTHQVGAWIGRARNGDMYIVVGPALFMSTDGGHEWTSRPVPPAGENGSRAFTVLHDGRLLLAVQAEDGACMEFSASADGGETWLHVSSLSASPFERIGEGFLYLSQLRDGTILFPVCRYDSVPPGEHPKNTPQHVFRSTDGGRSWQGGEVEDAEVLPVGSGPQARWPGMGGTFPGCYETHVLELSGGRLLAAYRYSGYPQPWHRGMVAAWGGKPVPDGIGRFFKQVFLGDSVDGGRTWQNLRPLLDADGRPVLEFGETHGHLQELPDGRLILVHDRRYPYDSANIVAHLSEDGGTTWRRERYHLAFGVGYPSSLALADGTVLTATTATPFGSDGLPTEPCCRARLIRWRVPD